MSTRSRLHFVVPEGYDITETSTTRSPILESLRSALNAAGWDGSMVAPWRPSTDDDRQHLIVWVEPREAVHDAALGVQVATVVGNILPGVHLERVEQQSG